MNTDNISIFDVYKGDEALVSSYIPFVSFSSQMHKDIAEAYVLNEADDFFKNILKLNIPVQPIPYIKTIGFHDFRKVNIDYFYNTLFSDICERDNSRKLINKVKWGITFDEEVTPIQVAHLKPSFSVNQQESRLDFLDRRKGRHQITYHPDNPFPLYRKYNYISLNGEPVFYYLHFTLQEILDIIKSAPQSS